MTDAQRLPRETGGISGAVFGVEDAQVMAPVKQLMHAIAANK